MPSSSFLTIMVQKTTETQSSSGARDHSSRISQGEGGPRAALSSTFSPSLPQWRKSAPELEQHARGLQPPEARGAHQRRAPVPVRRVDVRAELNLGGHARAARHRNTHRYTDRNTHRNTPRRARDVVSGSETFRNVARASARCGRDRRSGVAEPDQLAAHAREALERREVQHRPAVPAAAHEGRGVSD